MGRPQKVQASARRWRLNRIAKFFPQLIPDRADSKTSSSTPTIAIDFFGITAPLVKGKCAPARMTTTWSNKWGGYLGSAMNGGQWTQVRKSNIAKWNITDSNWQLCFSEPGTAQHRFHCTRTAPHRCTDPPPTDAHLAEIRLSTERLALLRHRAIGVVKVPAPRIRANGNFKWLVNPMQHRDQDELNNATWYTDGSLLLGR